MNKFTDWVIVGLGNPELKYLASRHNVGWMVAIEFASRCKKYSFKHTDCYYYTQIQVEKQSVLVVLPTTYMNNSGIAVKNIIEQYSVSTERIIVVVDEINFPIGYLNLKINKGNGGHNGILSIIQEIGTFDFYRLRCGVAREFEEGELGKYVLSNFYPNEIDARNQMLEKAVDSLLHTFKVGIEKAIPDINSEKPFKI